MMLFSLLFACTTPLLDTGDTGTEAVVDEAPMPGCDALELKIIGEAHPAVGDEWTVWLYCDGALLTGWGVLRFEPADFALVYDNVATFVDTGTAVLTMQVGSFRESMTVTVTD